MAFKPRSVVIDPEAADFPPARRFDGFPSGGDNPPKETVRLTVNKGPVIRSCPGTREYVCCGYRILHVGTGCPLDCSYCILQAYLSEHDLRVFADFERISRSVKEAASAQPGELFRLGTGEFTDSMALDHLTEFSRFIVPVIQRTPNAVLEFKTKTVNVGNLLRLDDPDRIIVSFSLNSPQTARNEEHRAASLTSRIRTAARLQDKGFALGFHFDPIVRHEGWREGYAETVELLFHHVDPDRVIWISMGCLRFMPQLKPIIRSKFPSSRLPYEEFIPGLDGKLRYPHPWRVEMFHHLEGLIRAHAPEVFTYLCMESTGIWEKALGRTPGSSDGLKRWLDERTKAFFPSLRVED